VLAVIKVKDLAGRERTFNNKNTINHLADFDGRFPVSNLHQHLKSYGRSRRHHHRARKREQRRRDIVSETTIPGTKAAHAWVTDQCRVGRTDAGARDEALRRLSDEFDKCAKGHPLGRDTRFHFVLTVQRGDTRT